MNPHKLERAIEHIESALKLVNEVEYRYIHKSLQLVKESL